MTHTRRPELSASAFLELAEAIEGGVLGGADASEGRARVRGGLRRAKGGARWAVASGGTGRGGLRRAEGG
jgi:hypothetical protein